jgi:hypothetical protein
MQPYIVCPKCGKVSHNANDVQQRYCGACHAFHDDLLRVAPPGMRTFFAGQRFILTSKALHPDCDYGPATVVLASTNYRSLMFDLGGECAIQVNDGMLVMQYLPIEQKEDGTLQDLYGNVWEARDAQAH